MKSMRTISGKTATGWAAATASATLLAASLLVAAPPAAADVCGARTGSPVRTSSWLGFKVGKKGRHVKGQIVIIRTAKKGSRPRVRGACLR